MSVWHDNQDRLAALGFNPGPVDGKPGAMTGEAVAAALWSLDLLRGKVIGPTHVPAVDAQPKASRALTEIVIHCTATPEGRDVTAADVRAWHKAQGWSDIGYHYLVRLDGTVEQGRPEALIGAHVIGHNTGTLGVCYAGGVDAKFAPKDTRTPEQEDALEAVCRALIAKYPSIKKVSGHRDYAPKACPSFDVNTDPLGDLV
jgi:N-acetylmuramoyl-L-alanine amidase